MYIVHIELSLASSRPAVASISTAQTGLEVTVAPLLYATPEANTSLFSTCNDEYVSR